MRELTPEQQRAVDRRDGSLLVRAGAGTGGGALWMLNTLLHNEQVRRPEIRRVGEGRGRASGRVIAQLQSGTGMITRVGVRPAPGGRFGRRPARDALSAEAADVVRFLSA